MAVETKASQQGSIPAVLDELEHRPSGEDWILSAYIDTSATRTLKRAYVLAFRDLVAKLRDSLVDLPPTNARGFDGAAAAIERFISEPFVTPTHGIAVFAGAADFLRAAEMPRPVEDELHWTPRPVIAPLQRALDDCERIGVLLFDKESTRFFTVYLGEIEARAAFTDDVPGKQATGDWYGLSQKRYARHHEEAVNRHAKRTIQMLLAELSATPFDRLFIAGPEEAQSTLRHRLPPRLANRVSGTLGIELFASEAEILRAATVAAESAERAQELADVTAVMDRATPYAVTGFENTLAALHERRVDRLLIATSIPANVRKCTECGRMTAMERCPLCAGMTIAEDDLPTSAIRAAMEQGASVDVVSGDAAGELMRVGGIAAWCRRSDRS